MTLYSWVRVIYAFHAMSRGHFHFPDRDSGWERKLPSCPSLPGTLTPNPGPCPPNLPFYTLIAYKVSRSVGRRLNRGCPSPGQPDVDGLRPPGLDLLELQEAAQRPGAVHPVGSYSDGHQVSLLPHQWPRSPASRSPQAQLTSLCLGSLLCLQDTWQCVPITLSGIKGTEHGDQDGSL